MAKRRVKRLVQRGLFGPIEEPAKSHSDIMLAEYDGQTVRMLAINSEPWWVATDVCRVLDLEQTGRAIDRLDDDETATLAELCGTSNVINGLRYDARLVNEPGLYLLIFESRKEEAKKFRRWVTHEVLPSIRKTGSYVSPSARLKKYARRIGTNDASTLKNRMDLVNQHKEGTPRWPARGSRPATSSSTTTRSTGSGRARRRANSVPTWA